MADHEADHKDTNVRQDSLSSARPDSAAPPAVLKGIDPVYEAKANTLNVAIQEIGMGWYQWQLFVVVGFGWASDNLWPIATSLILTPVALEFHASRPPLLSLAQNIGLLFGAIFWGFGCDVFGRRLAFNLTIGVTSVFGLIAAGSPNFAAIGIFACFWSIGVGGNLPVGRLSFPSREPDSAVFLEFLPGTHQYLLTVLSIFWAFAQLVATAIAWPTIGYHSCSAKAATCTRSENFGWRYFMIAMGGMAMIMFICRFVFFTLYESPKYLMGRGRDEDAVKTVHEVARRNGKTTNLTLADLQAYDLGGHQGTDTAAIFARRLEKVNLTHVRSLFATGQLAYSTLLITLIWAFIGLAFPLYNAFLPYIQEHKGAEFGDASTRITYRNLLIIAVLGIPGALIGGALVEIPRFGRKGALAISTTLTGVFLFASTTALTSNALLGWNCGFSFMSNVMYAVLYAYTPEVFPTKDRGTGNAITASANRIFGVMAPIIAMFGNLQTSAPVYVSGALFIVAGILATILPFEPMGKASL
ncbi:hypothetical protein MMC07_006754 [Pseudocyphellaria aurata]|nr:hypothetical protein [Pseudocyphellaria aurata]